MNPKERNKIAKGWEKLTLHNKKLYTISYAANVVDYKKYFPTVQRMAQKFDIKSQKTVLPTRKR